MTSPFSHRRDFLRSLSLGTAGGLLGGLARAASPTGKAKSVILIFNDGAPSHLDLWDPKPDAPSDVRGDFMPIRTNVPGIHVTELLPRMAKRMDKIALVRSVHHQHQGHNSGMYWATVGRPYRIDSTLINPSRTDFPSFGTLTGWLAQRDGYSGSMPPYVITPWPHCDSRAYITPGQFGGCLGAQYDPFVLNTDPNAPNYRPPGISLDEQVGSDRFGQRLGLLRELSAPGNTVVSRTASEMDQFHERAVRILQSDRAAEAFDLSKEPDSVRERYGRHQWGQSHLLARRLIEAGTRFVTTVNGPSIIWDTHKDNTKRLRDTLVPPMEQAYAALLDDLEERGLLDSTLVVWMGEFGRTPKINKDAGRDHWPGCYTVALAGGGIRGGQVVGASDAIGAYPIERAVSPADIHATVFAALGYDCRAITYRQVDDRPIPLSEGSPIRELLA
ncbi:MAG: DUF1501 domain-containing protein [Verrucomicrobiales bacterium]|nr:DUF1501 domain-containing protein [Verrucomicrobiales bacterium]